MLAEGRRRHGTHDGAMVAAGLDNGRGGQKGQEREHRWSFQGWGCWRPAEPSSYAVTSPTAMMWSPPS